MTIEVWLLPRECSPNDRFLGRRAVALIGHGVARNALSRGGAGARRTARAPMMRKPNRARATSDAALLLLKGIGLLVRHDWNRSLARPCVTTTRTTSIDSA